MVDQQIDRKTSLTKRKRVRSESSPSLEFYDKKSLPSRDSLKNLQENDELEEEVKGEADHCLQGEPLVCSSKPSSEDRVKFSLTEEDEEQEEQCVGENNGVGPGANVDTPGPSKTSEMVPNTA